MPRRVVITAASAITPIGHGRDNILAGLLQGVSGVRKLRPDDLLTGYIHSKVFGTIDYEIAYDFERKYRKTMGPVAFYACQAAKEVIAQAGLDSAFLSSGRVGVAFGSIHGSPTVQRGIYECFFSGSNDRFSTINAVDYLKSMVHTTAVNITKMFGITGRVISSSTACTTSSQSIGFGYETIKYGLQDAMLCGGADEYDTTTVAVFDNLLACSTDYNDTPHLTPRPFDKRRDGLVVGEGAGAVMLEEYEFAKRRGADILAEVIGFSCNNNGGDMILPNAQGVKEAIRLGLENAVIAPQDVDFISAHATGTKMGDVVEAQAMHKVYGDAHRPYVSALKSYMGHTMAACGAIETILVLYMMQEGFMAPTLNLDEVDPRCAMLQHVQRIREEKIRTAVVQNFAFGGVNTTLIIQKFP
jgi:3-oxoacyl-[acyl-carrier-protein] synthase II